MRLAKWRLSCAPIESAGLTVNTERRLTNLELTALGIIWKRKGCSAYDVMMEFAGSLTAQFKSRAGSVYPLIKRLHKEGLLEQTQAARGRQSRSEYAITSEGRRVLAQWMSAPVSESEVALNADPIRTRVYFLKLLSPKKRLEFLDEVHLQLKQHLKQCENATEEFREAKNDYAVLAMKGALRVTKARIAWIAEIRDELKQM